MSRQPKNKKSEEQVETGAGEPEEGPSIDTSAEIEAALAEASASIEEMQKGAKGEEPASADKLTIELLSTELQVLKEEFEARGQQIEEANDKYLRLQAEFENFRRRSLKERQESLQYGHQNLVKDLLSAVDNLERAITHAEQNDGKDLQGLLQGVELVQRELLGTLGQHGVTGVEAEGQVFDPTYHEAMGQLEDGSVPPNTVIEVLQKGYLLRDRMLRPARVILAKAPADEEADSGQGDTKDQSSE